MKIKTRVDINLDIKIVSLEQARQLFKVLKKFDNMYGETDNGIKLKKLIEELEYDITKN